MTKENTQEEKLEAVREWSIKNTGGWLIITGIAGCLFTNYFQSYLNNSIYQTLNSIFISVFSMGLISIFLDLKNWKEYFEKRLSNIIKNRDFINHLDRDTLDHLITDAFKAYYKIDDFD